MKVQRESIVVNRRLKPKKEDKSKLEFNLMIAFTGKKIN
jgi:galactokinase/mevalonate kinase-like predicted kinase